jgi:hypothetical protein
MAQPQLGRFGNRHLATTGDDLLAAMQKQRTMCLHALASDRNETRRFNDFLDNEAVTRHEMLVYAGQLTARRAVGRHVLVIADTSEANFATHTGRKRGFGTVGNGKDIGVFVHPLLAMDAEHGGILGLVGAEVITRPAGEEPAPAKAGMEHRKRRKADDKESRRWLAGAETAGDVLAEAAMITGVEDREGDIYDQFAQACPCEGGGPDNVHLIVRAARDRSVGREQKLFAACADWPEAGRYLIKVAAKRGKYGKGQRAERTALVAVRFGEVTFKRSACAGRDLPASLTMRVVDVREVDPPEDPKQRVHWCLLTTHTVNAPDEPKQTLGSSPRAAWYQMRWTIEQVFRTMKTDGVNVETSQITTPGSLLKLVTVALIAAIRVVQLVIGRDGSTGQKLTDVIADPVEVPALQAIHTTLEGRTQKLKNPHDPTSLAWYAARLVRLHLQGLQAAGTQDHGVRPEKTRCHDRRLLAGKSFRTYRPLVAALAGEVYLPRPPMRIGRRAILDPHDRVVQLLRQHPGVAATDHVALALESQFANRRNHRRRPGAPHLKPARLRCRDHLVDRHRPFRHAQPPVTQQRQHRIPRDPGQDRAVQRRRDHLVVDLQHDVHRADFVEITMLDTI